MRSFFGTIPAEMAESARIDGAREVRILFHWFARIAARDGDGGLVRWRRGMERLVHRAVFYHDEAHLTPAATLLNQLLTQTNITTTAVTTETGSAGGRSSDFSIRQAK